MMEDQVFQKMHRTPVYGDIWGRENEPASRNMVFFSGYNWFAVSHGSPWKTASLRVPRKAETPILFFGMVFLRDTVMGWFFSGTPSGSQPFVQGSIRANDDLTDSGRPTHEGSVGASYFRLTNYILKWRCSTGWVVLFARTTRARNGDQFNRSVNMA